MKSTLKIAALAAALGLPSQSFPQSLDAFEYRNVGPARGGRVTAVAGTVAERATFYLGASGGGVWKTTDYGTTWHNVSDGFFDTPSIGDIAVAQNDANIVYVGTGSDGLRSNVIAGKGMLQVDRWRRNLGAHRAERYRSDRCCGDRSDEITTSSGWRRSARPSTRTMSAACTRPRTAESSWDQGALDFRYGRILGCRIVAGQSGHRVCHCLESGAQAVDDHQRRRRMMKADFYKSVNGGAELDGRSRMGCREGLIGKIDLAISPADSSIVYALVEAPDDEGGLYRVRRPG